MIISAVSPIAVIKNTMPAVRLVQAFCLDRMVRHLRVIVILIPEKLLAQLATRKKHFLTDQRTEKHCVASCFVVRAGSNAEERCSKHGTSRPSTVNILQRGDTLL